MTAPKSLNILLIRENLEKMKKFQQITNRIGALCFLNILYIICCLPLITIGAANTALYACIFLMHDNKDGYMLHTFISNFKTHFKQSTLLWLGVCISAVFIVLEIFTLQIRPIRLAYLRTVVNAFFLAYLYLLSCCLFAFAARFRAKARFILRSCFILTARHFFLVLVLALMNGAIPLFLILRPGSFLSILPLIIFLGFSGVAYINGRILTQIFIKENLINAQNEAPGGNL